MGDKSNDIDNKNILAEFKDSKDTSLTRSLNMSHIDASNQTSMISYKDM